MNNPIQLVVETDKNALYQNSQLLVTLHIFHDEPLHELLDIVPPQLESGRVRTLGMPYTRIEQGSNEDAFHTTQHYALFPEQPGDLNATAPSVRVPSIYAEGSHTLVTQIPAVRVLPKRTDIEWLASENVILNDYAHPLSDASSGYLRTLTLTAIGTLPHHLPDQLLDTASRRDYALVERRLEEFHSRQGVTSQLHEVWQILPSHDSEELHPTSSIIWWDTQAQTLKQQRLPAPALATLRRLGESNITATAVAEARMEQTQEGETSFWLQVVIGVVLILTVLMGSYVGFRHQSAKTISGTAKKTPSMQTLNPHMTKNSAFTKPTTKEQDRKEQSRESTGMAEHQAYQELYQACRQNRCHQARTALVMWAACFWPDRNITRPESIYQANVSKTINYLLMDLEHHIKQSQETAWRGDLLLEAVNTLRRRRN